MINEEGWPAAARADWRRLKARLLRHDRLIVAFSGGVDSACLAVAAHLALGPRALAVTARSPSLAPEELAAARRLAARHGFAHRIVRTRELGDPRYCANTPRRCYYCKAELMKRLGEVARECGGASVALGANLDDRNDFRPGEEAAAARGAVFPLREAGLDKAAIRRLSGLWGLATADKPAAACLASRIPFGERVTRGKLEQVARAEAALQALGFEGCRVRHHGAVARLEVPEALLAQALRRRKEIARRVQEAGFVFTALDQLGYRMGALHEARRRRVGRAGAGTA